MGRRVVDRHARLWNRVAFVLAADVWFSEAVSGRRADQGAEEVGKHRGDRSWRRCQSFSRRKKSFGKKKTQKKNIPRKPIKPD